MLMAARDAHVKRFVYAAPAPPPMGDTPTLPKVETMRPDPLVLMPSASSSESTTSVFAKVYGLQTISLRYFNVFGPGQDPASQYAAAIPAFVTAILKNKPPTVYGDGEQSRDFTYIDNVVHANLLAARAKKTAGEVVNVACGEVVTVNAIIGEIGPAVGQERQADLRPGPRRRCEALPGRHYSRQEADRLRAHRPVPGGARTVHRLVP